MMTSDSDLSIMIPLGAPAIQGNESQLTACRDED
jgi:hypothetical protein